MLDLQHGQGRQHPPSGDARQLDQVVCQHGLLRQRPEQADLVVGQTQIIVGQAHRRSHRLGLRLLSGLIAQHRGRVLRPLPAQLVREPGLVFPQDVPGVGRQPGAVADQAVAAHAGRSINGSGDSEHVPPLLQRGARRDERTAALRRLHHQGCQREAG